MAPAVTGLEADATGASVAGQNAQIWGTAPGHYEGPERGDQVSLPAPTGQGDGSSMGDAGLNEGRRAADAPHPSPGQHSVEHDGNVTQTTFHDT